MAFSALAVLSRVNRTIIQTALTGAKVPLNDILLMEQHFSLKAWHQSGQSAEIHIWRKTSGFLVHADVTRLHTSAANRTPDLPPASLPLSTTTRHLSHSAHFGVNLTVYSGSSVDTQVFLHAFTYYSRATRYPALKDAGIHSFLVNDILNALKALEIQAGGGHGSINHR